MKRFASTLCFLFCIGLLWAQSDSLSISVPDSLRQDTFPAYSGPAFTSDNVSVDFPRVMQAGKAANFRIIFLQELISLQSVDVALNGVDTTLRVSNGEASFRHVPDLVHPSLSIKMGQYEYVQELKVVQFPPWLAILPPLLAILLALVFREVIISLFVGVFLGAAIIGVYTKASLVGIGTGLLATVDTYILGALTERDHIAIILFSLLIGGMVALISRNGGMQGIVNRISRFARSARSAQLSTALLGLVIFFDDYANTLVVGNTMRNITDKWKISREKLSYIVDSTAAPVASLAFITTWIGAELGYIQGGVANLEHFPEGLSAYSIFLNSLAYSFYPILTLIFVFLLIWLKRDFGPMHQAELRARASGQLFRASAKDIQSVEKEMAHFQPKADIQIRAFNAIIPVGVLVGGVLLGLYFTGSSADIWGDQEAGFFQKLSRVLGQADSYAALLWSSLSAVLVAILLNLGQRLQSAKEAMESMRVGFKTMLGAILILTLAWALQGITEHMHTADFLVEQLGDTVGPAWVPAITFLLGALVAFATGSSWGTMAILYPIIIPFAWETGIESGLETEANLSILFNVVSAVLAGSVLGDHCSPISDTTILSSLACSCDHIDHVRTQLPYALTVGGVAIFVGTIPSAFGLPLWISFPLAIAILFGIVRFYGKEVE
ncbi:MAG: Na+/H+ antiporter NhaC family protein [Bacteroidota bacterium]